MSTEIGKAHISILTKANNMIAGLKAAERRLEKFRDKAKRVGRSMQSVGRQGAIAFGAMTTAVVAYEVRALKTFATIQQELTETKGIIGDAGASYKELEKIVEDLGITTKFSQKQLAVGLRQIASAGKTNKEEMLGILDVAGQVASAIGTDLNTAVGLVISSSEAWSDEWKNLTEVADGLVNIQAAARIEANDLNNLMQFGAGVASGLGISFRDLSASVGVANQVIGNSSTAVTGLRQVITGISAPTKRARAIYDEFGITMDDLNFKTTSLEEIFKMFRKRGLEGADMMKLFSARGGTVASVILKNTRLYEGINKKMDEQGSAARRAEEALDTLMGRWVLFTSSLEALDATIGKLLSGDAGSLLEWLKGIVDSTNAWMKANPKLTKELLVMVPVIGAILTSAALLVAMIGTLMVAWAGIPIASTAVAIGVIIASVELLLVTLGRFYDRLVDFGGSVLDLVKSYGVAMGSLFKGLFNSIMTGTITPFYQAILRGASAMLQSLGDTFNKVRGLSAMSGSLWESAGELSGRAAELGMQSSGKASTTNETNNNVTMNISNNVGLQKVYDEVERAVRVNTVVAGGL